MKQLAEYEKKLTNEDQMRKNDKLISKDKFQITGW